jgi:hypothetical protein
MLHDVVADPAGHSPEELRAAYEDRLRTAVTDVGTDEAAEAAGVDADAVAALAAGESPALTVEEAAALLGLEDGMDSEVVVAELRNHLLMGMSTGVLDVDTIASNVELDLSGQEIQQALEGRVPMTLAQLAAVHRFIDSRN